MLILIDNNKIADSEIVDALQQVWSTLMAAMLQWHNIVNTQITSVGDDDDQLRTVAQSQFEMLLGCGYTKPIAQLTHKDIPGIVECVTLHSTIVMVY